MARDREKVDRGGRQRTGEGGRDYIMVETRRRREGGHRGGERYRGDRVLLLLLSAT